MFLYVLLSLYTFAGLASFVLLHEYPIPVVHDEFAYLLTADTFLQGRLTNPPPPLDDFFATFHVVTSPFYNGKYPPGQGLQLALGHILGHPLHGVWITAIIWTCTLYWLFKSMVPKTTAFWGVVLFSPFFTFLSYHGYSYWGGTMFALGGTLALGGVLYCWDRVSVYPAILCGLGLGIMQMTRPLEGLIFCIIPLLALSAKHIRKGIPGIRVWAVKFCIPMAFPLVIGLGFHLLYNWANTGHPLQLPYMFYSSADVMRFGAPDDMFAGSLPFFHRLIHAWEGIAPFPWSFVVIMGLFSFLVSRNRTGSFWMLPAMMGAVFIVVWASQSFSRTVWPHYVATWFALIGLLAMLGWQILKEAPSKVMKSISVVFGVILLAVFCFHFYKAYNNAEVINAKTYTGPHWNYSLFGEHRQHIKNQLLELHEKTGLNQVVFVSYAPDHNYHDEWIYNRADIFNSPVIWARDLGYEKNQELLALLPPHQAWSIYVESDQDPPVINPVTAVETNMDRFDSEDDIKINKQ